MMAVPDFQTLMLPVLQAYADGKERSPSKRWGLDCASCRLTKADLVQGHDDAPTVTSTP